MCNRDNAHDVDIFPDEKITKRSEPTNQAQTKINIVKGLQTYLNDLKIILPLIKGLKYVLWFLKSLVNTDIFWINEDVFLCFNFKSKSLKYNNTPYSDI